MADTTLGSRCMRLMATAAFGVSLATAAPAVADTEFGQTGTDNSFCMGNTQLIDPTGAPSDGTITMFHFAANGTGTHTDLQVLRPTATPGRYTVIGRSGPVADSGAAGTVTDAPVNIAAKAGDVLGMYVVDAGFPCLKDSGAGDVLVGMGGSDPDVGDTVTVDEQGSATQNLSATLVASPPIQAIEATLTTHNNGNSDDRLGVKTTPAGAAEGAQVRYFRKTREGRVLVGEGAIGPRGKDTLVVKDPNGRKPSTYFARVRPTSTTSGDQTNTAEVVR